MFKQFIIGGNTWCYHFCNATFYNSFCWFWIFQLIADSYTITCFYQFMQVSIQCMMRKTGQFTGSCSAIVSFGKCNAQHLEAMIASSPKVS